MNEIYTFPHGHSNLKLERTMTIMHKMIKRLTKAVAVVILDPPAAPIDIFTLLSLSTIIAGHMDDRGRLPGFIKLAGDAGIPK